jgi:hypothetical protein
VVERNADMDGAVCSVLRVFADTVLHIPEHRRLLLFHKILTTLGPEHSLWSFLCLVLEEHVTHSQEELTPVGQKDRGEVPQRLEFALNLTRSFSPFTVLVTCIKMVKYVHTLPVEKGKIINVVIICLLVKYGKENKSYKDLLVGDLISLLSFLESRLKIENEMKGMFHIIVQTLDIIFK